MSRIALKDESSATEWSKFRDHKLEMFIAPLASKIEAVNLIYRKNIYLKQKLILLHVLRLKTKNKLKFIFNNFFHLKSMNLSVLDIICSTYSYKDSNLLKFLSV